MILAPLPTKDERRRRKQERLERHARDLRELAAIGMDLARTANNQAFLAEAGPGVLGEISLAFSRVSRSVRQTMALETEVEDAINAIDDPIPDSPPERRRQLTKQSDQVAVQRDQPVEPGDTNADSAGREQFRREAREDLLGDLDDDLDAGRLYTSRKKAWPIARIVARISRVLPIKPKNPLRTDANGQVPAAAHIPTTRWRSQEISGLQQGTRPPDG